MAHQAIGNVTKRGSIISGHVTWGRSVTGKGHELWQSIAKCALKSLKIIKYRGHVEDFRCSLNLDKASLGRFLLRLCVEARTQCLRS
ncbi:Hypothetical predicted protein [Cloeon dipterum]|uniref:Uncharacterized protein n=1 Tax=Cloeon dipterum TaxID=197152 RepID=A0A8S1DU50_9INSE|nr:Hypothetical predicted protein [Cloeon dipterum]